MFNKLTARSAGSKGGEAKTKTKSKAARSNGSLGGRPPTKTLAEKLLGRTIHPEQQRYIDLALSDMLSVERQQLEEYFHLERGMLEDYFMHGTELRRAMNDTVWRTKSRRVPERIRYLIKKFRLAANHYLREPPSPKPYSVEYEQRSSGEQQLWHLWHAKSEIPCPPLKVSVDVRQLPNFRLIELKHKKGLIWAVKDLTEISDKWTKQRAEVAIKWLNSTYPQSRS